VLRLLLLLLLLSTPAQEFALALKLGSPKLLSVPTNKHSSCLSSLSPALLLLLLLPLLLLLLLLLTPAQGFALALKMGSIKQQLDSLVGIHPTSAEEVLGVKGPARMYRDGQQQQQQQQDGKQYGKHHQQQDGDGAGKAGSGKAEASRAA
jgi:hypothetical protein